MPRDEQFQDIDPAELGLSAYEREHYFRQTQRLLHRFVLPVLSNADDVDALSVGCGMMFEAEAFLRTFPKGRYFGIDVDDRHYMMARMVGLIIEADEAAGRLNFEFEGAADVYPDDTEALMNRKWKLIFGRNIQFIGSRRRMGVEEEAVKILDNSVEALDIGGVLLLTHFNPEDRNRGLAVLTRHEQQGRIKILQRGIENPYPSYGSSMPDHYVSVAIRVR